ncbi:EcoAI/FtnUII family type I restriction enzme subunit R [Turneriella parva]|uniref:EcoEI R domain protein n=1 Tax=Turneriella parva (strain ATCC BAA-1111 / DSM 21527 / NCTC 11395 / H) TaxID=869212 RepID=I4B1R5_TURPD|nr:type I restriction endonuclease subunit R [Turneriella parva]AFM11222.1 EcoEI R domain protein [Turneriella parva DSM 21527]
MNEAQTRAEIIDPQLVAAGWGVIPDSRILREYHINEGKIQLGGGRGKKLTADYVLVYRNLKMAVVEAKSDDLEVGEGVAQAKLYAEKLALDVAYAANGREIYGINMQSGGEGLLTKFPSPDELWNKTFEEQNEWRDRFNSVPFEFVGGKKGARFYQEIAVNRTLEAIAQKKERILLTLATGTGKTFIAFQIAWKLFKTRWNLKRDSSRQPRILFLADRNILADQAFNDFSAFPEDALVRINPKEINKAGKVLTNGSVFFTIFQTFMTGRGEDGKPAPYFGSYPPDFFDFIIIDECHRGGAQDESNWRGILEYFAPAVQLGLTATPKRNNNVDTYKYFGEPIYTYSLKEGINDGYLTPFKVKRIKTTLDDYFYTSDDEVLEGEVEQGRLYTEPDFNRIIEIKAREEKRVQIFLADANPKEKAIIFCATQDHAAAVRDIVNQLKKNPDPLYCVRVTANDGSIGDQYLKDFRDNEKTIPTILTTSQKLSTGVDARNIRNIVLLRPVRNMIEFKQIVGRGTRLFDGKDFFTIYDFVNASLNFLDPEWDGDPLEPEETEPKPAPEATEAPQEAPPSDEEGEKRTRPRKIKIRLRDGKEREIQHMVSTSFWSADGKPLSVEEFLQNLYGKLPELFKNEAELRSIWSSPTTRRALLERLADAGYGKSELASLQALVQAEKSDLFDVLEYIAFAIKPITREARVNQARVKMLQSIDERQREFLDFVLAKYIESGVEELDDEKLPNLLELKYESLSDATAALGDVKAIRSTFIESQKYLYFV